MESEAVWELAKHALVNLILHGLMAFSASLIGSIILPLQIPINSIYDALNVSVMIGAGAGVLGVLLAIEQSEETEFEMGRIIKKFRDLLWHKDRTNGNIYEVSSSWGLHVRAKKRLVDYIIYFY